MLFCYKISCGAIYAFSGLKFWAENGTGVKKYKYQVWETFNLIQFIRSTTMQTRYTCPGTSPHYIFPMGMGSSNMVASILRAGNKQCHVHAWCSWWLSCSCSCSCSCSWFKHDLNTSMSSVHGHWQCCGCGSSIVLVNTSVTFIKHQSCPWPQHGQWSWTLSIEHDHDKAMNLHLRQCHLSRQTHSLDYHGAMGDNSWHNSFPPASDYNATLRSQRSDCEDAALLG